MNYIEIAQGSPRNRGSLILKKDLLKYINPNVPLFRSIYLYDKDAYKYSKENGGLKDYFGKRDIDNIILDIDKGKSSDEHTREKAISMVYRLEEFDVSHKSIQCYFSGSGYHISIPNSCFGFICSDNIHYIVKNTVGKLFPEVDNSIFMRTGIYRIAHTVNKKTNLYKIPISVGELFDKRIDFNELASKSRIGYAYSERIGNNEMQKYIVNEAPRVKQANKVIEPLDVVPCVQRMLQAGPQEGNRNQTLMRIASHCSRHGIPSEYAKSMILHWNNNSLNENEVIEKVEYTYNRGYKYGCQDSIMHANCQTRCIYFKRKDYLVDVKNAEQLQKDLEFRLTTDFSGKTLDLAKSLGLNVDCEIYPGELVTIFGPTGSGKTTFAQNLALGVDFVNDAINIDSQIPCLYLSLELSAWYMHRRNLQIVSGLDKDQVTENFEKVYALHKEKIEHLSIQTVAPNLDQIQQKVRELQPAVVVVDYIDLISTNSRYMGEYEQIKQVSHYLSNLAVNMDIIIIQISQVSRDYSRNEALDLYAGKGSGAIENASRKVIGLNGQANDSVKSVHMYKNTDGELFDTEVVWQPSFRFRRQ
tara:strand:- start:28031 stop:29788 length:1758 start_codon:yes stop_codon:yes gene_type:complete